MPLVLLALPGDVERARKTLGDAMKGGVGAQVDKYFGTKLPPVCERLGCFLTDDGQRFYCVNPACHKDKKRTTKHSRVRRKGDGKTYFRCPACGSRSVDIILGRQYRCTCGHEWPVK